MPHTLQIAMQTAISKQGVAVIALPGDIATLPMPNDALVHGPVTAALSEFTLVGVLPSLGAFLLIWAYLARTRKIHRSGVDHQD